MNPLATFTMARPQLLAEEGIWMVGQSPTSNSHSGTHRLPQDAGKGTIPYRQLLCAVACVRQLHRSHRQTRPLVARGTAVDFLSQQSNEDQWAGRPQATRISCAGNKANLCAGSSEVTGGRYRDHGTRLQPLGRRRGRRSPCLRQRMQAAADLDAAWS
ncbi:hypothetical protein NDU88_006903 [Pleurodeles waltl]|uniref:Uncharacterized protein n=1 Tax=Pleurodeles waltl TaxID=8319 RepID=A0AAV7SQZ8_PLEWA|nr:hypothetical protein NDU88_006903 [Pleurodeles waltl]